MGHWFGRFIPIAVGVLLITVACTDPDKPSGIPDPKGNNGDVSNIGGDVAIDATLPTVTITAPAANAMAAYGELVQFSGTVSDNRDAPETLNVRWLSDLDGAIAHAPADANGVTSFALSSLISGRHTITLAATDGAGNTGIAAVAVTIAAAVGAPTVTIEPASPTTLDRLLANVTYTPDPSATFSIEWRGNGEVATAEDDEIPSALTTKGELWSVRVVAHTSEGDTPPGAAQTRIYNAAPQCLAAAIVPTEGTTTTTYACQCVDRVEPDAEDPLADRCELAIDGVFIDFDACTVTPDLTAKDDLLSCSYIASDGEDEGAPRETNTVIVGNTPPTVGGTAISADGCGRYTCMATDITDIDDSDSDFTVAYRWTLNGSRMVDHEQTLEGIGFAQGDALRCIARATDGSLRADGSPVYGEETVSAVHAINEPLSGVQSATLLPAAPVPGDLLTCMPSGFDGGNCGWEPSYIYAWLEDGAVIAGADSESLRLEAPALGTSYQCRVTPTGGSVAGPSVLSNAVAVGSVDPGAPIVEISAPEGADGPVLCNVREAATASMDDVIWHWQINDEDPFEAGQALGDAAVEGCDLVRCWAELPNAGVPLFSNQAQQPLPMGSGCDDGNSCTTGACSPDGGCEWVPTGDQCDDDNVCTGVGACIDGVCIAVAVDCDDDDPCTADSCHPLNGCTSSPSSGATCDDGNVCTTGDTCIVGACFGTNTCSCGDANECDDGNPCTTDTCPDGTCHNSATSGGCNDGDDCTENDQCTVDGCRGNPVTCTTWYLDADEDGFGSGISTCTCGSVPGFTATVRGDCNDNDGAVHPDASDAPGDGVDSNCDSVELCYVDADLDGYRTDITVTSTTGVACNGRGEITADALIDCDDDAATVSPGTPETPGDNIDSNCDEIELCYLDSDMDGYRSLETEAGTDLDCSATNHLLATAGLDCDDSRDDVNPGAIEISDDGVDSNCDLKELFNNNLLGLAEPLSGSVYDVAIFGDFDMGPLGVVHVDGSVERDAEGTVTWCTWATMSKTLGVVELQDVTARVCMNDQGMIVTSVVGNGTVAGYPLQLMGSFALYPPYDYELLLTGQATLDGQNFPLVEASAASFVRRVDGEESWQLSLAAGAVPLGAGVVLEETVYIIHSGGTSLSATTRFGDAPNDIALTATGAYFLGGDYAITLALADGETWDPFGSDLPVEFTTVSGTLARTAGLVDVTVVGEIAGSLGIVPGLTLTNAKVTGVVAFNGDWSVELSGENDVDLGDGVERTVTITGGFNSDGVLHLNGEVVGALEPLESLIGAGRFVIDGTEEQPFVIGFEVDIPGAAFTVTLDAPMTFCPFGGCSGEEIAAMVHAEGTIDGSFAGYFIASIEGLELPGFGPLGTVAFAAATAEVADVDMFNDGEVIRTLPRGITMAASAPSPIPLEGMLERYMFIFTIMGPTGIRAEADFGLQLKIIRPEDQFPTIEYVDLVSIYFFAEIRTGVIEMGIGSAVEFKPTNQDNPLVGSAEFAVSSTLSVSGTISIVGRWYEPFMIQNFAVQNPGFALTLKFLPNGVPVPQSLGWNLDIFWLKSGQWPTELPPDVEFTPANVFTVGNTFFYDAVPSESGLCFVGACAPTPTVIFRFNLENITFAEMIDLLNRVRLAQSQALAAVQPYAQFMPESDFAVLDPQPIDIDLDTLRFELSTHNTTIFGQPFTAGGRVYVDATVNGVLTLFEGSIDPDGLMVNGYQDGFALPGIAVVGDPLWREAILHGGTINIPHDSRLTPSTGMIEGWVRRTNWTGGAMVGQLAEKGFGTANGWGFGVGDVDGDLGRLVLHIHNGGTTRVVSSVNGVVEPDTDAHIAWQWDGAAVGLYHNGVRLTVNDSGPAIAPGANSSTLRLGAGMQRIDDVRIWDTNRSLAQISGQARQLPTRYINVRAEGFPDSPLVARYEFDWDNVGASAYNSREYASGPSLDGSYVGGADDELRVIDNPKILMIDITKPPPVGRAPGFGLKAGVAVGIPGIPETNHAWAISGKLGNGSVSTEFFASNMQILPIGIPGQDSYLGSFWVGGNGRNLLDEGGHFDDGIYGEADFANLYFAGSGLFEFRHESGLQDRWSEGTFVFDEPTPYMYIDAFVNWVVPLSDYSFGVAGAASFDTRDPFPQMQVEGDVVILGESFIGVDVMISQTEARFTAGWQLPDPPFLPTGLTTLAGATTSYTVNFIDQSFCGETSVTVAGSGCTFGVCFYTADFPEFSGSCDTFPMCGNNVCEPYFGETCGALDSLTTCRHDCGQCPNGTPCLINATCSSDTCNLGFCIPYHSLPGTVPCTTSNACRSDSCSFGVCETFCNDGYCEPPTEICGGSNTAPQCNDDCGGCPNGTPCVSSGDCASNVCNDLFCIPYRSVPGNLPCTTDDACMSGDCLGVPPSPQGVCSTVCGDGRCEVPVEICGGSNSGIQCRDDCGRCPPPSPCGSNSDCTSDACNLYICVPYHSLPVGIPCDTDNACMSGNCQCDPYGIACICM